MPKHIRDLPEALLTRHVNEAVREGLYWFEDHRNRDRIRPEVEIEKGVVRYRYVLSIWSEYAVEALSLVLLTLLGLGCAVYGVATDQYSLALTLGGLSVSASGFTLGCIRGVAWLYVRREILNTPTMRIISHLTPRQLRMLGRKTEP
ncbi:MAG: hypothetical protein AAGI52_00230 [Bacteroidota bacterium]